MNERTRKKIIKLRKQGFSVREIQTNIQDGEDISISVGTVYRILKEAKVEVPDAYKNFAKRQPSPTPEPDQTSTSTEPPAESAKLVSKGKEDEYELQVYSIKTCMTIDEAIRAAGADPREWEVSETRIRTSTIKMKEDGVDKIVECRHINCKLKRVIRKTLHDAMQLTLEQIRKTAPDYKQIKPSNAGKGKYLCVLGLFDVHFGKLCWEPETGSNYDTAIASTIFRNAVVDLVDRVKGQNIDRFLLPIGNDWLHIDNRRNSTTRGTPVDTDGRFSKVFAAAKLSAIWAVEYLMRMAPVKVVWVPGNHDQTLSEMLCHVVDARFHNSTAVTVDAGPRDRKYEKYGSTLLGFSHGDKIKAEQLPCLMAQEQPQSWADTLCREWLLGHQHRERQWVTKPIDTHMGTTVRVLQSLAGTDAWHYEKGFVGARQAAECYLYGRDEGYAGHWVVSART